MKYQAIVFLLFMIVTHQNVAQTLALKNGHAHNDYMHEKPLLDALSYGFTSIEADIHLINNELYVTHDAPASLDKNLTLRALYLDPLREHISKNKGAIYTDFSEPVLLMIDIKTEAEATYQLLTKQLEAYKSILYSENNKKAPLRVVISGNRAIESARKDSKRLVSVDGRPSDLTKNYETSFMPIVSQNYNLVIKWKGDGKISDTDFSALKQLAAATHKQGKKLRLWASPENEEVWKTLLEAGIDFINTDQLQELNEFFSNIK